jgi:PAS domain S-box-containing protein
MKPFRDQPLQRKMTLIILVIVGVILSVSVATLFAFQIFNFRSSFQSDTEALVAVVANNSTAALAFNDASGADEVLASLKAVPTVVSATLTTPDGKIFSRFGRAEAAGLGQFPPPREARFTDGDLLLTQPVVLDHKVVGTLLLRANFHETFWKLLRFYAIVIFDIAVLAVSLAIFLAKRFQRFVTEPVLHLAKTAEKIGREKAYFLRATVDGRRDELGQLTESFNNMLGRIQDQDAAISVSQNRMQVLINSIDGIVWSCNPKTLRFSFISRQCLRILGYSPEEWLATADFWQTHLHPDDEAKALLMRQEYALAGKPYTYEYRMLSADGRTVWIRESGSVLAEAGDVYAMRGIFLDITAQKAAASELERLNRHLLETSRLAGMAEVATGVLHNVGNVLNSVSVSATLVGDRLKQSKVTNLRRAVAMLHEHHSNLGEFLATDPKGKLLPDYLIAAADHLANDETLLLEEMKSVVKNIEHIKEIVSMQQNFAKVSGAYETLSAVELVEDALLINAAAFERHRVQVIRQFDETTPPLFVDRHKVLQILINLFGNAKYAMDVQPSDEKRLIICIEPMSSQRARIVVTDNGVGISSENLIKIFTHGFTTKEGGHGFGLHSSANAAKEIGGSLTAQSDGTGRGATFILELPTAQAVGTEKLPRLGEPL